MKSCRRFYAFLTCLKAEEVGIGSVCQVCRQQSFKLLSCPTTGTPRNERSTSGAVASYCTIQEPTTPFGSNRVGQTVQKKKSEF
ncbi:unnamed protein product [Chondrus crispus]|uniref:Uncharacterized protein n=1 Tax=Chondrus crispus TaxID=2769 RepID=R7QDF1_CHOCR|nr:unnamed protein product [Chondrus crispus]CDF35460.1 unnamed protein product [Chondrus crispus]|eukprot:XP_005715279.1 unnamed protein product [Chondrus crispus]